MEKVKMWFRKNWQNVLALLFMAMFLFSPDAKAWFIRQVASTGFFNSKITEKTTETDTEKMTNASQMTVINEKGESINLEQLRGKVVFINFWASWCPPCRAEFPSIQKFYKDYKDNPNVEFLLVNLDENQKLGKDYFLKEHFNLPFHVPQGAISETLFSGALPTTLVLDKKGQIRMQHTGFADYGKDSFYKQIDDLLKEK